MKSTRTLYEHLNGGYIELDLQARELTIVDADGTWASVGIGPAGLADLSETLRQTGQRWGEALRQQGVI